MTEAQTSIDNKVGTVTDVPVVVRIKPGTSSDKGLMFELKPEMKDYSIDQLIAYAKNEFRNDPKYGRIVGRVDTEMNKQYGLTANQTSVKRNEKISAYTSEEKTLPDGTKYKEIEIVVAAEQEGGIYKR